MFWDTDDPPKLVKSCISRVKDIHQDLGWEIRIYNETNICNYIREDLEMIKPQLEDLCPAHKADVYRICLMHKYGGVWIDASVFLQKGVEKIFNLGTPSIEINAYRPPFDGGSIENWMFSAPKKHPFIKTWKDQFLKAVMIGFRKYLHENKNNEHIIANPEIWKHTPYLTMHFCSIIAIGDESKRRSGQDWIQIKSSIEKNNGPFYLHIDANTKNWDSRSLSFYFKISRYIRESRENSCQSIVKLRSSDRWILRGYEFYFITNTVILSSLIFLNVASFDVNENVVCHMTKLIVLIFLCLVSASMIYTEYI
jgi:hypothetical protein